MKSSNFEPRTGTRRINVIAFLCFTSILAIINGESYAEDLVTESRARAALRIADEQRQESVTQDFISESSAKAALRIANEQLAYAQTQEPGTEQYRNALERAEIELGREVLVDFAASNVTFGDEVRNAAEALADLSSAEIRVEQEAQEVVISDPNVTERINGSETPPRAIPPPSTPGDGAERFGTSERESSPPRLVPSPDEPEVVQPEKKKGIGLGGPLLVTTLIVLGLSGLGIYLHSEGRLTIYRDYTDVAITALCPVIALGTFWLLGMFGVPSGTAKAIALIVFCLSVLAISVSTAMCNRDALILFPLALLTKFAIILIYGLIMGVLMLSGSTRRKGERSRDYEARRRRETKANKAGMAAATAGFVGVVGFACRYPEFRHLGNYFSRDIS